MIKRILAIFYRDLKMSTRNFLTLYIIVVPIILAIAINVFSPGISDSTVEIVLLGESQQQESYFKQFAKVEVIETLEAMKARVKKRDNIIGLVPTSKDDFYILTQGNEPEYVVDYIKELIAFEHYDIKVEDTQAEIIDYGREIPPLKKILVNISIMFISILGGMIIALNIVEEKTENTISAIHLTPVSRMAFIAGKSLIGIFIPIIGTFLMLIITGFTEVNFFHAFIMMITSCIVSVIIGFIEGINNDDVMNAAGNMKMLFLPLVGAVVAIELLGDKWQPLFYWIPFYWTYQGNSLLLSNSGSLIEILKYAGLVLIISAVVGLLLGPKIKKGLE